ncbi:MAG: hypothetical protein ACRDTA_04300 [Pseudonocardiaceae bacterium]
MTPTDKSSARQPNRDLQRVITTSGASHSSLAHRLNQLASGNGLHTSYTHTSWANWTRRGTMPAGPIRPLIAQVLAERLGRPVNLHEIGMDTAQDNESVVGLDFPRDLPSAIHAATRFWSQVDRRHFCANGAIALVYYHTPLRRWLTTPADPDTTFTGDAAFPQVGQADITELLAAAEDARWWDSRYGGGNWRTSAITTCLKERAAPLLHGRYCDDIGKQLFSATAQLSRLAGWSAFDNGQHALAQRHYIQALRQARAGGDIPLGGYILVCMALQATLRGFHDDAIDMVDGAFQRARHHATPRVLAFYKLIEARIWARNSNPRAASTALATSERLLSTATNHSGDDPTWIDFFDHPRLAADATEIHRDLAMPTQALRWNHEATMPTKTYARAHTLRLAVLGTVHLQGHTPDLHQAIHYGHQTVDVLRRVTSARALDYLNDLLSRLNRWHTEPAVRQLHHRARTELLIA